MKTGELGSTVSKFDVPKVSKGGNIVSKSFFPKVKVSKEGNIVSKSFFSKVKLSKEGNIVSKFFFPKVKVSKGGLHSADVYTSQTECTNFQKLYL